MSSVSTSVAALTVAQFLEMYPSADAMLRAVDAGVSALPTIAEEPSTSSESDEEIEGEEIMVKPKPRRGRPKKVRTPQELAEIAEANAAKEVRRIEREAKKAAKAAQPKRPRGRPKKVRTPEELEEIAEGEAAKEARRVEREAKKAAKDAEPKRPRGRPKKVRTPEELAEIAEAEAAKEARQMKREMDKLVQVKEQAVKDEAKHMEKIAIYTRMLADAAAYAEKWNIDSEC